MTSTGEGLGEDFGAALSYTYDAAGNCTGRSVEVYGGSYTTYTGPSVTYDALNRPTQLYDSGPASQVLNVQFHWDALGRLSSLRRGWAKAAGRPSIPTPIPTTSPRG